MSERTQGETWVTFLGVRADGAVPVVDLQWLEAGEAALSYAQRFLSQHDSCAYVEVWSDGRLRGKTERAEAAAG